jgi:CheY-like chemotaxis protein
MTVSILVVDDESDVADLFRQRFRREVRQGTYAMHFAHSGEEALEKLANGIEPMLFVILSDINMPGMDGLTLLREIKMRRPDLPVIMVTAYGDDERRRMAEEYGAAQFITKPIDFDLLKAQLQPLSDAAAALHLTIPAATGMFRGRGDDRATSVLPRGRDEHERCEP